MPTFPLPEGYFSGGKNLMKGFSRDGHLALVLNSLANSIPIVAFRTVTEDDDLTSDDVIVKVDSSGGPVELTLPDPSTVTNKTIYIIHTVPDNLLTVLPYDTDTINNETEVTLLGDGTLRTLSLVCDGTDYWII